MKYALITGANRGIGYYLAKEMALDGYGIVMIGRNKERLENAKQKLEAYTKDIHTLVYDLGDPQAPEGIYRDVKELNLEIDILANNAGFGSYGSFHTNDIKNELDMMQVNMTSLVHLTHLFSQDMVSKKRGKILNVSSVAGFQSGPHMNIYFASKSFVLHFSEALAYELKPYGIQVTALCPGSTDTDFFSRAEVNRKADLFQLKATPESVAIKGYKALKKGKSIAIPGLNNKFMIQIQRFVPRKAVTAILGKGMSKK